MSTAKFAFLHANTDSWYKHVAASLALVPRPFLRPQKLLQHVVHSMNLLARCSQSLTCMQPVTKPTVVTAHPVMDNQSCKTAVTLLPLIIMHAMLLQIDIAGRGSPFH